MIKINFSRQYIPHPPLLGTTKCVRCLKKVYGWSGHVLRNKERILAGWCRDCSPKVDKNGFAGYWSPILGRDNIKR